MYLVTTPNISILPEISKGSVLSTLPPVLTTVSIEGSIPHRPPFLLVDRVLSVEPGKFIQASKLVSSTEWWAAQDQQAPLGMPHSLVIEALAQASAILLVHSASTNLANVAYGFLSAITSCHFGTSAWPGDTVILESALRRWRHAVASFAVRASVKSDIVAAAQIVFVVRARADR